MTDYTRFKIAVLATDGFEESELLEPVRSMREAGALVKVLAPPTLDRSGMIQAFRHHSKTIKVPVDHYLDEQLARPERYDALILPGGALNADQMRVEPLVLRFVQTIDAEEKPVAAICHAPWILISAGLVRGRILTSYPSIQDDVKNAGGRWLDREVVSYGNWVTSRKPSDLPAFNSEIFELLSRPLPLISEGARASIARSRIA